MKNFEQLLGLIVDETPENKIMKKQLFNIVHEAIGRLNPKHRKIVHLFYWDELSYRKIAKMISSTPNSVGVTLTNIRKKLRSELKKLCVQFG
jgi:RNA polymerase sigma-70 factor (ECF subfamily)